MVEKHLEKIPTVSVIMDGNAVNINASDFDPDKHKLNSNSDSVDDSDEITEEMIDEMKKSELIELAEENEIEIDASWRKDEIKDAIKSELLSE